MKKFLGARLGVFAVMLFILVGGDASLALEWGGSAAIDDSDGVGLWVDVPKNIRTEFEGADTQELGLDVDSMVACCVMGFEIY